MSFLMETFLFSDTLSSLAQSTAIHIGQHRMQTFLFCQSESIMKELNLSELEAVSGGIWKAVGEAILGGAAYDIAKSAFEYAMKNSHMGQGRFPPVQRPGRE